MNFRHSVHMKEEYENVKTLLNMMKYTSHNRELWDFKMLAFLLGQQGGYTKYSCFSCLWNSRADDQRYSRKQWSLRECTQCYSPSSSSEKKDFVANTPHKAWACKAVGKGFKIRQ